MPARSTWVSLVDAGLAEDLGPGDATSDAVLDAETSGTARIEAREAIVLSGLEVARAVFERTGATLDPEASDGMRVEAGGVVALVSGTARAILAGERVALNFLQHLSGIATLTDRFCEAIRDTGARILDTRKTTPGLRVLEKYAVRCGGGYNHRHGLFDGILIKDNHIRAVGSVGEAVRRARAAAPPGLSVEVEVESLEAAREALAAGAQTLLIDNQPPVIVERIVKLGGGRVPLEASGGVRLENVAELARTGVDWISIGALTHSARAVDLGLEWNDPSRS
jgi:nicotinate-nucleotide pyrophosphorylase (carboxylating)